MTEIHAGRVGRTGYWYGGLKGEPLKIHLGCGHRRLEGYTHVDSRADVGADYCADVGSLPFPDESVSLLYACHVLEHVPRREVESVLEEWHRVLEKPRGTLRISVPDFEEVVRLYGGGTHLKRLWGLLHGRQDYPENVHFCSYDYQSLAGMLPMIGFFRVRLWDPWTMLPEEYDDYSKAELDDRRVSLNIAADAK